MVDWSFQDTYYVVAHFTTSCHAVFSIFPARTLVSQDYRIHVFGNSGEAPFLAAFVGVNLAFFPMHFLGLAGMPRRIADYSDAFAGVNEISSIAAYISAVGLIVFFAGLAYALVRKVRAVNNPWGAGATTRVDTVVTAAFPRA